MYSIGDLSRRTGVKVPTIRYYEEIGLIAPAGRTEGNQRRYERDALDRLGFIRHARDLGLSIEAIRDLVRLDAHPEMNCGEAHEIVRGHLAAVEARIARLERLRHELARIADRDAHECIGQCAVIDALADHAQCGGEHRVD
jgi:Predicted transcriptional regulators